MGSCGNAVFLFVLCWKKTWNCIDKASRGYSDLERDNQNSEPEKTQYLFICCKQYSWKCCQISYVLDRVIFRLAVLMASVWVHNIMWIKREKKKKHQKTKEYPGPLVSSQWCQVGDYWVSSGDFFQNYQFLWVLCRKDDIIVCVPDFQGPVV